jgi:tetratricopeptide (TPR) repeat protein
MEIAMRLNTLVVALFALFALAGLAPSATEPTLGSIDFPNSGAAEAQGTFNRAVLLLHSFEYEDAREAFQEAQQLDPNFALAYWGEAMTHNAPLWRIQDRDAARAALAKLAPTADERRVGAATDRERGYLHAVKVLYGDGEKITRDQAYSEELAALCARYPDDLEARAFYALSVLGTAQGVRDFSIYMRAAAIAEEVFAANPSHPGAAHYLIHSYDDPVHAPLGLRAARVYAQIAPSAGHAQHMISHIYVALGWWAESVDSNVKSFEVSAQRKQRKGLGVDAYGFHALHWLEYSYLQLGRFQEARGKLNMMHEFASESGSARALWYHAAMRAAYIVETGAQDAPPQIKPEQTQVTGAAADLFAGGYAALQAGNVDEAESFVRRLDERYDSAASGHLCGQTGGFEDTTQRDLAVAEVMQDSLRALIAMKRGETTEAIALFEKATAAEAAMSADFGPPVIVKPSHELYGTALLELGRPEDAKQQFEIALQRAPRRSLSLAGLVRAASAIQDQQTVADACENLKLIYATADESVRAGSPCTVPGVASR